jgi:hypothetical protein
MGSVQSPPPPPPPMPDTDQNDFKIKIPNSALHTYGGSSPPVSTSPCHRIPFILLDTCLPNADKRSRRSGFAIWVIMCDPSSDNVVNVLLMPKMLATCDAKKKNLLESRSTGLGAGGLVILVDVATAAGTGPRLRPLPVRSGPARCHFNVFRFERLRIANAFFGGNVRVVPATVGDSRRSNFAIHLMCAGRKLTRADTAVELLHSPIRTTIDITGTSVGWRRAFLISSRSCTGGSSTFPRLPAFSLWLSGLTGFPDSITCSGNRFPR